MATSAVQSRAGLTVFGPAARDRIGVIMPSSPRTSPWNERERVPRRSIATAIAMVLATAVLVVLVIKLERILIWIVVALFFAVVLAPVTALVQRRLHLNRAAATFVVFLLAVLIIAGIVTALVQPVASQGAGLV